jgi:hypothetical protein
MLLSAVGGDVLVDDLGENVAVGLTGALLSAVAFERLADKRRYSQILLHLAKPRIGGALGAGPSFALRLNRTTGWVVGRGDHFAAAG